MSKTILFSFLLASQFALAGDLGFRYTDGQCKNANGETGLNPSYVGECGDLRGTVIKMNLDDTNLRGSKFDSSDLRSSTFKNADLTGTVFTSANVAAVDFTGAKLINAKLVKVNAVETILKDANATGADLSKSFFRRAMAKNINLEKANLENSDIRYADFSGASFTDAVLKGCIFNNKTKLSITKAEATRLGMVLLNLFEFTGIQSNIEMAQLDGWNLCYKALYSANTENTGQIMNDCKSKFVMLACRKTGSNTLSLAAYGTYEKVFYDNNRSNTGVVDNDVQFYFSPQYSMGFAPKGVNLARNSCDTDRESFAQRLCWHTSGGGGWSCAGESNLNGSDNYEKLIFKSEE
jgi:uncharacterized protein YjbI with pentapeptide repeats